MRYVGPQEWVANGRLDSVKVKNETREALRLLDRGAAAARGLQQAAHKQTDLDGLGFGVGFASE